MTPCPYCANADDGHTFYTKCPLCLNSKKVLPEIASLFRMIGNGSANDADTMLPAGSVADIAECRLWECAIQAGDIKQWHAMIAWVFASRGGDRCTTKDKNELFSRVARRYLQQCNYCIGSGIANVAPDGSTTECKACTGWGILKGAGGW